MSAPESATRRVALLARPGAARDNVRGALLEIGADIVVEDDPTAASPDAIRGASPEVLMIVLDAVSENALDRFDSMLGDPAIEVMFEEAEVAAGRDGWEAARWRRHLAAKLHHRDDVLPPVAGAELVPAVDPLAARLEGLVAGELGASPLADADVEVVELPATALAGDDFSIFDPAAAEGGDGNYVLSVQGLELEPTAFDDLPEVSVAALDLDSTAIDTLPPVTGPDFNASDFDPLLAELDAELPDVPLPEAPALADADWQGDLVDGFADATPAAERAAPTPPAAVPPPLPRAGFGELSLADDITPVPAPAAAAARTVDLDALERRIAALELVDDTARSAPGAVLLLAGLGGPDAVRQFLGALPARFPRAVLLRQRLDGARYDRLVAQLQRASTLPVVLAAPGAPVVGGHVYVMGDGVGLAEGGAAFCIGDADCLIDRLPAGSAIAVLSGADPALADRILACRASGGYVGVQSPDGCYDPAAANAVAAQGAEVAAPSDLAQRIADRWMS